MMMFAFAGIKRAEGATYYAVTTGNWNVTTTWSTGGCGTYVTPAVTPGPGDNVIVCLGITVTVNVNVTVANVTVNNGGVLQNGGGSTTNRSLTVTGALTVSNGGTLIQNSILNPTTTLFAGTESFGATSTVTVSNWFSPTLPLINSINSNFGSVNLNWGTGTNWWKNQGLGVTRTIAGNLTVGTGCQTFLDSSNAAVSISIGGSLTVNGKLRIKYLMPGAVTFLASGNGNIGAAGEFNGTFGGNGNVSFTIQNLTSSAGGTFCAVKDGIGNATVAINGIFTCAGNFYGIDAPAVINNGVPTITMNSLAYTGGIFMASNTHNSLGTATVTIATNANVSFTVATDRISLIGLGNVGVNNVTTRLVLNVGGNLSIGGLSTCSFKTSESFGEETITVNGTFTSTAARTLFNGGANELSGHKVRATFGGFVISGGNVWFSENTSDSTLITVNGTTQLSGGTLILKSAGGYANFIVNGSYAQNLVGSVYYMHGPDQQGAATLGNNFIDMRVNGTFTQSGGVMHFDVANSPAEQRLYINGPSYTISNIATMQRAGYGTSTNFARIIFEYAGTITYFRNLSHNIQQCKQTIRNGCRVNVTSGPFQISSHNTPALDFLTVESGGILSVGTSQISSDSAYSNTGVTIQDNARLILANTNGLYDGTIYPVFRSTGNMNYFLGANSTVEYNTATYARVTGINIGVATLPQHKYGILEINHVGPAGTWVSPTYLPTFTNAVFIRTRLVMTAGEFNLADAGGSPVSAGRYVYIENPSPSALLRTGGYIRSEVQDHSGRIVWTINNTTGTYLLPWGVSSTQYIPLTYNLSSGGVGTVSFSTYRTPATNLPWPPGVTNLASHIGLSPDNRIATVDRFWRMANTGTAPVLNLTFNYVSSEMPGIPYNLPTQMRAHAYNSTANNWMAPLPGQSASAYQVIVPGAGGNTHWAISSLAAPLPVEWLSVNAYRADSHVQIEWATASEKDCDYYTVFRSGASGVFEPIGTVKAAGNSSDELQYFFKDLNPVSGSVYYKIKQTDFNGDYSWSDMVYVTDKVSLTGMQAWINESSDVLMVRLPEAGGVLNIVDALGRTILTKEVTENLFEMPVSVANQMLFVKYELLNRVEVVKVGH
jgi:hypothetical protein